jgi:hypothetical protein
MFIKIRRFSGNYILKFKEISGVVWHWYSSNVSRSYVVCICLLRSFLYHSFGYGPVVYQIQAMPQTVDIVRRICILMNKLTPEESEICVSSVPPDQFWWFGKKRHGDKSLRSKYSFSNQAITRLLWNSEDLYRIYKSCPLVPIRSQVNSGHTLLPCLHKIYFTVTARLSEQNCLLWDLRFSRWWQFWRSFCLNRFIYWLGEANVSEKRAISIFRAEVMSRDCEGPCI